MKYWEIIADKLSADGWTWGYCSAVTRQGRRWWVVDAYQSDGKRYIVQSDELLSAFLELEATLLLIALANFARLVAAMFVENRSQRILESGQGVLSW